MVGVRGRPLIQDGHAQSSREIVGMRARERRSWNGTGSYKLQAATYMGRYLLRRQPEYGTLSVSLARFVPFLFACPCVCYGPPCAHCTDWAVENRLGCVLLKFWPLPPLPLTKTAAHRYFAAANRL